MTPQNQRSIGWLVAVVGIIALATLSLRSQSASNQQPERFSENFQHCAGRHACRR